jgi:hypothetical protein
MGVQIPSEPITRKEQYFAKIAGQAVEIPAEPITREEAYLDEIAKNGSGGGGGTTNYNSLSNKPQIAGTELQGNKSLADLGIASEEDLAGKQNALTAGQYIEIDNDTISVKRDISKTAQQIEYNFTIPGDYTLRVKKYVQGDLVDTTDYTWNSVTDQINLDSIMEVSKKPGGGFYWVVKNLIASTTQAADYSVELYALQQSTNYTQNFVATIDADKKLIIQSELDAAVAGKVDKVAGKGLSTNDYTNEDKAIVGGVTAALGGKADTDIVASDFSTAVSYTAGNYCIYDGKFYKFKASHSGAWSAADVDEIKIAGELSSLKSGLISVDNKFKDTISIDTGTGSDGFIPFIEDVLDHALSLGVGSHIFGAGRVGMYFCTVSSSVASATRAVALVVPHAFNSSEVWQCGYENGSYYVNKITATAVTN